MELHAGTFLACRIQNIVARFHHKLMQQSGNRVQIKLDDRTADELREEGQQVSQMIEFGCVIPERENLPYYLITMKWYTRWQKYTGCFKKKEADQEEQEEGKPQN